MNIKIELSEEHATRISDELQEHLDNIRSQYSETDTPDWVRELEEAVDDLTRQVGATQ